MLYASEKIMAEVGGPIQSGIPNEIVIPDLRFSRNCLPCVLAYSR